MLGKVFALRKRTSTVPRQIWCGAELWVGEAAAGDSPGPPLGSGPRCRGTPLPGPWRARSLCSLCGAQEGALGRNNFPSRCSACVEGSSVPKLSLLSRWLFQFSGKQVLESWGKKSVSLDHAWCRHSSREWVTTPSQGLRVGQASSSAAKATLGPRTPSIEHRDLQQWGSPARASWAGRCRSCSTGSQEMLPHGKCPCVLTSVANISCSRQ